jgi:hypothetical protein
MRSNNEPEERAQFTVAELLARYGESAPATGRRHRRAAEQPATAAPPIPERNWAGSREPVVRPSSPPPIPDAPTRYGSPGSAPRSLFEFEATRSDSIPPASPTQPPLNDHPSRRWAPAVGGIPSAAPGRAPLSIPVLARRPGMALPDGPVTDQLPRLEPETHAIPEQIENVTPAEEARPQVPGSLLWEWALMVSQVGIGIAGGAVVWLICEWFWQRIPVVALIVALAVITGLVWVVRRIRCAEDLQTTVIAVLVGLFVTVSPAALLLVGR